MKKHNLRQEIGYGDGICKISNFLPTNIAEGALKVLESIQDSEWRVTESSNDYNAHLHLPHKFCQNNDHEDL